MEKLRVNFTPIYFFRFGFGVAFLADFDDGMGGVLTNRFTPPPASFGGGEGEKWRQCPGAAGAQ
jgi:hypothetical protein